jgi:threonine dehydratase
MISKADIEKAYAAIRPYIVRTPTVYSQKLSDLCGCQTLFKLENLQMTGSFKERGALNKLLRPTPSFSFWRSKRSSRRVRGPLPWPPC